MIHTGEHGVGPVYGYNHKVERCIGKRWLHVGFVRQSCRGVESIAGVWLHVRSRLLGAYVWRRIPPTKEKS